MAENDTLYVDLDDVIAQTNQMVIELAKILFNQQIDLTSITSHNLGKSLNLSEQDYKRLMSSLHEQETLMNIQEDEAGLNFINKVKKQFQLNVIIVTGRPPFTRQATVSWLRSKKVVFEKVIFIDKYSRYSKADPFEPLRNENILCAIEDSLEFSVGMVQHLDFPILLLDRPWNQHKEKISEDLTRIYTWEDAFYFISKLLEGEK